jgi:hypothetical protein
MALLKKYQELKDSRKTEVEDLLKEQAKKVCRNSRPIRGTETMTFCLLRCTFSR